MNKNNDYLNFLGLSTFFEKIKTYFASKDEVNILNATVAENKNKLDGIADGANNYIHPETSGNKHIPSGGSSGQILSWCGDGTAKWINHNTINGITDSLTAADSNIALSAKAGNDLQNQISELNSEFSNLTPQDIGAFPYVRLLDGADLNTVVIPGVYYVYDGVNSATDRSIVIVLQGDESWVNQIEIADGAMFDIYMRVRDAKENWTEWRYLSEYYMPRSGGRMNGGITMDANKHIQWDYGKGPMIYGEAYKDTIKGLFSICPTGINTNADRLKEIYIGDMFGQTSSSVLTVCPAADNKYSLGINGHRWSQLYAASSTISASDRKQKKNIKEIDIKYIELFNLLQPVSFQFQYGTSGRTHIGFISQDIESAMDLVGLTDLDFAGFCKDQEMTEVYGEDGKRHLEPVLDDDGNPVYNYSLRYEEFIALNTAVIQQQQKKLSKLEARLAALEEKMN